MEIVGWRLQDASSDLQRYDRALVQAHDLPRAGREQWHVFAGRLAALVDQAQGAAKADDMPALSSLREEIAAVEGQMLAAGANGLNSS
jgi:hypothetical protein